MAEAPRERRSRRQAPEVKAERVRVLLDDPNVREVFATARKELVTAIERCQLDGTKGREDAAIELVRQLQSLNQVQRIILRPLVAEAAAKQSRRRSLNMDGK